MLDRLAQRWSQQGCYCCYNQYDLCYCCYNQYDSAQQADVAACGCAGVHSGKVCMYVFTLSWFTLSCVHAELVTIAQSYTHIRAMQLHAYTHIHTHSHSQTCKHTVNHASKLSSYQCCPFNHSITAGCALINLFHDGGIPAMRTSALLRTRDSALYT